MVDPCFHAFGAQRLRTSQRFAEIPAIAELMRAEEQGVECLTKPAGCPRLPLTLCEQLDSLRVVIEVSLGPDPDSGDRRQLLAGQLDTRSDGTLEVPSDFNVPGWCKRGPSRTTVRPRPVMRQAGTRQSAARKRAK